MDCETPQQNNSVDCGVYLTLITERLLSNVLCKLPYETILPDFSELDVWLKRCFMSSILCNIHANYDSVRRKVLQSLKEISTFEFRREKINNDQRPNNTMCSIDFGIDKSVTISEEVNCEANHLSTLNTSQPRLTLVGDSQGKVLAHYLNFKSSNDLVFGNIFSGAPLHSLISFLKNDKAM